MLVGFNHNVMYKGEIYHVQTEDSGIANPHITTLLYRGGTILASRKTSYADIIKIENLEKVVEELMQDQHKELMRSLKNGALDDRIAGICSEPDLKEAEGSGLNPDPPLPVAGNKSLDDLLLDYLVSGKEK